MWLNEIFKQSFGGIKTNYNTWLLVATISFIVGGLPALIAQPDVLEFYKNVSFDLTAPATTSSFPIDNNASVLGILGLVISILITPGIMAIGLMGARGERGKIDRIIKKAPIALKLFGFSIVYLIAVFIGTLALIIPGIYLLLRYSMTPLILVDRENIGVFDAMKESSDIMKGKYWSVLFNFYVLGVIMFTAFFAIFVISFPLLAISDSLPILTLILFQIMLVISSSITYPLGNIGYGVIYTRLIRNSRFESPKASK